MALQKLQLSRVPPSGGFHSHHMNHMRGTMKKLIGLLLVTAAAAGIGPHTLSWGDSLLPPGISTDNWIALGDRAGFVVTNGDSLIGSTGSVGVATGYFMLRRAGTWLRIDPAPDYRGAGQER
jgi:hypothetical protein